METVCSINMILALLLSHQGLLLDHILVTIAITCIAATNVSYLLHDDDLKKIIFYSGWPTGFLYIFKSRSSRQSLVQIMGDEWRMNNLPNNPNGAEPTLQPSSSKQSTDMDLKRTNAKPSEHPALFDDAKLLLIKKFYRQLLINKMLVEDETTFFQCDDHLKSLAKLEEACLQHRYNFDNDLFVAIFNEFTLHQNSISKTLSNGNGRMLNHGDNSSETLDVKSLFDKSDCNTKSILQMMLDNIDNELIFGECWEILLSKANHEERPVECSIDNNVEVINEGSSTKRPRSPKDRRRKGKKSKVQTTSNTPILPFSEASVSSTLSTNNSDCDDTIEHSKPENRLATCDEEIHVKCTSDGMNDYYNLNMPIYNSDA